MARYGKQDRRDSRLVFMAQTATVVGACWGSNTPIHTLSVLGYRVLSLEYEGHSMDIEILQWRISLQRNQIARRLPHLCTAFLTLALTSSAATHVRMFGCNAAVAVCSSFRKMGINRLDQKGFITGLISTTRFNDAMFNYVQRTRKGRDKPQSELSPPQTASQ